MFIKLTNKYGKDVHVNVDQISSFSRNRSDNFTKIEMDTYAIYVNETCEEILELVNKNNEVDKMIGYLDELPKKLMAHSQVRHAVNISAT